MINKESTILEALQAEMLGDILKLHDTVSALKVELPIIVDGINAAKNGLILEFDNIQTANSKYLKDTINTSTSTEINALKLSIRLIGDTEIKHIRDSIENDQLAAIEAFEKAIDNKLSAAFKNIDAVNSVFVETKKSLIKLLDNTNTATEQYKTELDNSIIAARQSIKLNWLLKLTGVFAITFVAVIAGAFVYANYIQHLVK